MAGKALTGISDECRAAEELRRDAHERLAAGQWFAAARRLANANGVVWSNHGEHGGCVCRQSLEQSGLLAALLR